MTGAIVSIVMVAASLVLALRAMRSHTVAPRTIAWMAGAWAVIIAAMYFAFARIN
jgi:hypothetical protein